MDNTAKIEFISHGAYRFIGKSVYARSGASDNNRGSGDIFGDLWKGSNWIFAELDMLPEYASDLPHKAALMTWDAYTPENTQIFGLTVGKTQLLGYCVGKFMAAETPVPAGFDYIDIPAGYAAKGWINGKNYDDDLDGLIRKEIEQSDRFKQASWRFMAEIYPSMDENGMSFGYYISCEPLTEQELEEKSNQQQ